MSGSTKKKICWNCEGNVSVHEENCPYCAVYIGPAEPVEEDAVLAPPYQVSEPEQVPQSPYIAQARTETQSFKENEGVSDTKSIALSLVLFSGGAILLLFGLVLWLFSQAGVLTLTWKSDYWYVYLLFSLPMLFLGWRQIQQQSES